MLDATTTGSPRLSRYPAGVPAEIALDGPESSTALFSEVCDQFADRPAFANVGATLSFAQIDALGRDAAPGERGELWVEGPQVMRGYWQRPEETAKLLDADGWLRTGDIATMDEQGFVRIVDRLEDMIVVSGFNVFPNEVEAAVGRHACVVECACIGVPDEKSGEAVKVFVTLVPSTQLELDELREHCKQHLTAYKVPRQLEIRSELPKTNVGKILRRALRP